jgi:hypothetical protein
LVAVYRSKDADGGRDGLRFGGHQGESFTIGEI